MKKLLFYFLVATFSLGVLTRITIVPSVNIYLQDIVIVFILLFSWKEILQFAQKKNIFVKLYLCFALVGVIGVVANVSGLFEIASSLSYLARLTAYLLLIIPLLSLGKHTLDNLKKEMVAAGFIFVFFGYIQYFYYPALRNLYYLGWDEHLYRLFSTMLDPNFAGAFIVLIILLYSSFVFSSQRLLRYARNDMLRITLIIGGYLFLFPALLLTYSRSSYIMAVFSFILFLLLIKQKKLLIALGAVLILGIFLLPKGLGGEGVKLFRTASIFARTSQYENSIKIISSHPIIGVGFNSLRFVSGEYGFLSKKDLLVSHAGAGVPNSYLFIMATTGVAGLLLVTCFWLLTLKGVYRRLKDNRVMGAVVMASFVGVFAGSLFENFLFFSQIMLWLVICFGILFGITNYESRITKKRG